MTVADVVARDAEEAGGGGDIALGLIDGALDEFVDSCIERETFPGEIEIRIECATCCRLVCHRSRRPRERGKVPLVAFLKYDRTLEIVAENADVARPGVLQQPRLA